MMSVVVPFPVKGLDVIFQDSDFSFRQAVFAFYQDMDFSFHISPQTDGSLGPFYHIGSKEVPVQLSYTLSIQSPVIDPEFRSKLLIISHNEEGETTSAGGEYKEGAVVAKLRSFGAYGLALDTISPEIIPHGNRGTDFTGKTELRFTIRDELSGINKYEAYIDNHWALFEYDPKNELLLYKFDQTSLTPCSRI